MRAFVLISVLLAAQKSKATDVPAPILDWASADPYSFVALLTEVQVPAGLEIRDADYQAYVSNRTRLPRWNPYLLNRTHFLDRRAVPASAIVDAFNLRHTDYLAGLDQGVVVIRPSRSRLAYLDT